MRGCKYRFFNGKLVKTITLKHLIKSKKLVNSYTIYT